MMMTESNNTRNPNEVVVIDAPAPASSENSASEQAEDDFFSSWDKPAIKRPSNPPSRSNTPPVISRSGSPFLTTGSNSPFWPKSPLSGSEGSTPAPVVRNTAAKKTGPTAAKKGVLGAKKPPKLGAKKVTADAIDFDAAERQAKEEAERIEKLGYDPETEKAEAEAKAAQTKAAASKAASPASVPQPQFTPAAGGHQRKSSDLERLGMGIGRLGFGQVGNPKGQATKKLGFGATAAPKTAADGMKNPLADADLLTPFFPEQELEYARNKFGSQKGISSDEFFGRNQFDPTAQAEAKSRLSGFEGATSISSNAYFGRPEEDEPPADDYDDLESAAKDFVRKFGITAGDDLDTLTTALGEGAMKLQGASALAWPFLSMLT